MQSKSLRNWSQAGHVLDWDAEGRISTGSPEGPVDGLFYKHGRNFLQIFHQNSRMIFSDGENELDVSDAKVRAFYVNLFGGEILFLHRGILPIRIIRHWAGPNVLAAINDPTYDRIDFETDRFLLTCAKLINNKGRQAEVIDNWRSTQRGN